MTKTLVLDPGGKNFAWVKIKDNVPINMGYFKLLQYFEPKDPDTLMPLLQGIRALLKGVTDIIFERYIVRQAVRGVSSEKLIMVIGFIYLTAHDRGLRIHPLTSSTWKRKVDYKRIVNLIKKMGYYKKDIHMIDCLLMYSVINQVSVPLMLRGGIKAYDQFRKR
jgi:hypothetical protein